MYSGEDSSGDPLNSKNQFANWALSQAAAFSTSTENVDWAALAQQWIQMKESCSINNYVNNSDNSVPEVPPPPRISSKDFEEQGEAPMEVVKDDENFMQGQGLLSNTDPMSYQNPSEWQSSWFQNQTQYCPTWNTWTASNPMRLQMAPPQQLQIAPVPSMNLLKDGSHTMPGIKIQENMSSNEIPTMDAARRKTLPAWIREGLEKMEKEKLKQLERSRGMSAYESKDDNNSKALIEKDIIEKKSLLDISDKSDEDEPENDDENDLSTDIINTEQEQQQIEMSREERIEELMLIVRKSLTELLLEVTNEEILTIAQEAFRKYKAKASSVQVFRKSALSTITTKLGLGAYADSGSDNSGDESEHSEQPTDDSCDSEEDLKESIRARHEAFKLIAQKIEASCMESEERDYRRNMEKNDRQISASSSKDALLNNSPKKGYGGNNYDNDSGETHPDKKMIINGKRAKERTSRFSSNKDSKYKTNFYPVQTAVSATTISSSSSVPSTNIANIDYEKRKNAQITTKHNSYSSDSSSSSSESDSGKDQGRYRKSRSSREKLDKIGKSRHRERTDSERSRSSRDRNRERSRGRDRHREKSSQDRDTHSKNRYYYQRDDRERRDSERSRDRDRHRERSKHSERDLSRDRDLEKNKNKEMDSSRDRERSRDRDRNREKNSRDRSDRGGNSEKNSSKLKEKIKGHEKVRSHERDRDRDRDSDRDRYNRKVRIDRKHRNSRNSSDSDDYYSSRRKHRSTASKSRNRSRSQSRSQSRTSSTRSQSRSKS